MDKKRQGIVARRRSLSAWVWGAAFIVALTISNPALAEGKACKLNRLATLPVKVTGNQILIPGSIGGNPVDFVFDTEFPASLILAPAAPKLGLDVINNFGHPHGEAPFAMGTTDVQEWSLGPLTIHDTRFGVFGYYASFAGGAAALLGNDFWLHYDVEIDLRSGTIQLLKAEGCTGWNLAYWSENYNVVDVQNKEYSNRYRVMPVFKVSLNGQEISAMLDSGSPYSTVTWSAVKLAGEPMKSEMDGSDWGANGQPTDVVALMRMTYGLPPSTYESPNVATSGSFDPGYGFNAPQRIGDFAKMTIDQETIEPARLRILKPLRLKPQTGERTAGAVSAPAEITLGVDFLLSHRVLIANSQGKLYFSHVERSGD